MPTPCQRVIGKLRPRILQQIGPFFDRPPSQILRRMSKLDRLPSAVDRPPSKLDRRTRQQLIGVFWIDLLVKYTDLLVNFTDLQVKLTDLLVNLTDLHMN